MRAAGEYSQYSLAAGDRLTTPWASGRIEGLCYEQAGCSKDLQTTSAKLWTNMWSVLLWGWKGGIGMGRAWSSVLSPVVSSIALKVPAGGSFVTHIKHREP